MTPALAVAHLGRIGYDAAYRLQKQLVAARARGAIEDVLLLLEHPPTVTHSFTGRGAEHLLAGAELLAQRGVEVHTTDRGGDITFHGPGQLVGYPIVLLRDEAGERDLHRYLRMLEEVLIASATAFGVDTTRIAGRTGTWLRDGSKKLAAIGVKASRWVTHHGFAINVATDLSFFDLIVPCGIDDAGVTSLAAELGGKAPSLTLVADEVQRCFCRIFERSPSPPSEALTILLPDGH